jgi:hypothetical protein
MLRNPVRPAIDSIYRAQLTMFQALGDQISLSEDDRRRALDLDDRTWRAWTNFLANGPLPAKPASQEMLRRLGKAAFILSTIVEQRQRRVSSAMSSLSPLWSGP